MAAVFLQKLGYRIVSRNYRQKTGEIDIIAKDGDTHVFVEVKTRYNADFGEPAEAVTRNKQRQISAAALEYLSRNDLLDTPVRFDVVGISMDRAEPIITHLRAAFEFQR